MRLTIQQPGAPPQHLAFPPGTITLGRANDCTVPIKDRFLSRRHAEIVALHGGWVLRDCGSANGTLLNGVKVGSPQPLRAGDRIELGDTAVIFDAAADEDTSKIIAVDSDAHERNLSISVDDEDRSSEAARVLSSLAVEFLADRPMAELFDFLLDRIVSALKPTRAALALLGRDKKTFETVKLRRSISSDRENELVISRTLLNEVVGGRKVVSFFHAGDDRLAQAESIIAQQIRAAVCAPLVVGDDVLGVLYLDFLGAFQAMSEADVRLIGQIARFAAVTLERTRLREEALAKAKIDEELRTAYVIQSRLLPAALPEIEGYRFAGANRPCKTVSGDYYDVLVRPDGRIYFVIADVSGKGITAALVMSSVATAFEIFTRTDPRPADLLREINVTLAPKTAPTKFVTLFAGVLDPATDVVEFANGGHVPPLVVGRDGVQTLSTTDLVIGLIPAAQYRNQSVTLAPGDSLVLFTDGVTEAENAEEEQLGLEPVAELLRTMHGTEAPQLLRTIEERVRLHTGDVPAGDDVTMLALTRVG